MIKKIKLTGNLKAYLRWPVLLTLLFAAGTVQIYYINRKAGVFAALYTLLYFVIAMAIMLFGRKKIHQDLILFAQNYGSLQMKMMKEMSIPFAILDCEGHLLWGNDDFLGIIHNKKAARRGIQNIFSEITENCLPNKKNIDREVFVNSGEMNFRSVMRFISAGQMKEEEKELPIDQLIEDESFIVMYLYDETQLRQMQKKFENEKMIVGLLYIDNFEETLSSIDEVRQSLLSALIDRKINTYMQRMDAISKKLEKDKYLFVFKQKYMEVLKEKRFSILDEIRAINIGNEQQCSISIGIGVGAESFEEQYNWARAAIDLALGRGGDQAVIKSGDNEEFFGGKRVALERNTRVKARAKAHALREQIESKEQVIVMGHSLGDTDSFGASVGIYRIAKTLGRRAYIVMNQMAPSVKIICDRFYNNKEYENDMIITGEEALNIIDDNTLLVIVDVNKEDYTDCPELVEKAQSIVVIDHHRQAGDAMKKAVLFYIEPYASSASEMVAEISQYINTGLKLKAVEAEAMFAGIMIDTNFFADKTGVRTFEAMAYLKRNGADTVRLRKAFRESLEECKIRAAAVENINLYRDYFAISDISSEGLDSPTVMAAKIANSLLDINGVKGSFVLTEYNDKIYISARSIDEVNVQVMMERFGGGGHINMAGAQLQGKTMEEAKDAIRQMIDQMLENGEIE